MKYVPHIIHLQAAAATTMAVLFAFAPKIAATVLFKSGGDAITPLLRAFLVVYGGVLIVTTGTACSMRYTKETIQGVGFAQLLFGASFVWLCLNPITNPAVWAFAILNLGAGAYFLATANQFPSEAGKAKGPKSVHMRLMHMNAGIAGTMSLAFTFGRKYVADLLWTTGSAGFTPELENMCISLGVILILTAGTCCSIKVTKATAQGVGIAFLAMTAAEIFWCLQPVSKPVNWVFVAPFAGTALYFLATSGNLPTDVSAASNATASATAAKANTTAGARETRKAK